MDKFTRKTTTEERAMDYVRGVKYVGGEIQLAMQAAVVGAFIEGRKDAIEEARREQPVRVTDELAGRIWDVRRVFGYKKKDYWGGVSPLHRETFASMLRAALAAEPKEGTE